jgi:hypothetical protein
MIRRSIVLNTIEPAMLSARIPLGVNLDLAVTMKNQRGEFIDQTSFYPQLILLPRSHSGAMPFDMEIDIADQSSRALVHGSFLTDALGYNLELYQRGAGDPPVPVGLLAKGHLATEGSAYTGHKGALIIVPPVVVGPPGPPGPTGTRGSIWFSGSGVPIGIEGAINGDMYLDELTGDVYRFENGVWSMI